MPYTITKASIPFDCTAPAPTVLLGLGGYGSKCVDWLWEALQNEENPPLAAFAIDSCSQDLSYIRNIPTVPFRFSAQFSILEYIFSNEEHYRVFRGPHRFSYNKPFLYDAAFDERRIVSRKIAYTVIKNGLYSIDFCNLEEKLLALGKANPKGFTIAIVSGIIGFFSSSALQPIAARLTSFLEERGIAVKITAYLLSPALANHYAGDDNWRHYHAHATLKELIALNDPDLPLPTSLRESLTFNILKESRPLFSSVQIIETPFPMGYQNPYVAFMKDTIAADLLCKAKCYQRPAIGEISSESITLDTDRYGATTNTSLLEALYSKDPATFQERIDSLTKNLSPLPYHELDAVIIPEAELDFIKLYLDEACKPIEKLLALLGVTPKQVVVSHQKSNYGKITFLYRTPFVAFVDYRPLADPQTAKAAIEAYRSQQTRWKESEFPIWDPHIFTEFNEILLPLETE